MLSNRWLFYCASFEPEIPRKCLDRLERSTPYVLATKLILRFSPGFKERNASSASSYWSILADLSRCEFFAIFRVLRQNCASGGFVFQAVKDGRQYRLNDRAKHRPDASVRHLEKWQESEIKELSYRCRAYYIIFSIFSPSRDSSDKLMTLLRDFLKHTEGFNAKLAKQMDKALATGPETVLLLNRGVVLINN